MGRTQRGMHAPRYKLLISKEIADKVLSGRKSHDLVSMRVFLSMRKQFPCTATHGRKRDEGVIRAPNKLNGPGSVRPPHPLPPGNNTH